jgi:hypothetical protein
MIIAGDARGAARLTDAQVQDWVDDHLASGGAIGDLVRPVWRAFFISGALGYSKDVEAEEGVGEEGKDQTPAPPAAIQAAE